MEDTETKFLGIIIYNKKWKPCITYISKKVAKHNDIILKANMCSISIMKHYVHLHIHI